MHRAGSHSAGAGSISLGRLAEQVALAAPRLDQLRAAGILHLAPQHAHRGVHGVARGQLVDPVDVVLDLLARDGLAAAQGQVLGACQKAAIDQALFGLELLVEQRQLFAAGLQGGIADPGSVVTDTSGIARFRGALNLERAVDRFVQSLWY